MFHRLKSLPLTILLTILIWMYAEAQFTSTREGIQISLNVSSPVANYSVRVQDPADGQYHQTLLVRISVEGPQNKVDQLEQATKQLGGVGDSLSLSFQPPAAALQAGGGELNFDTVALLNGMPYFRDNGLIATMALPARLRLQTQAVQSVTVPIVLRSPATPTAQVISMSESEAKVSLSPQLLAQIGGAGHLSVAAVPLRDIGALPADTPQTVPARLVVDYPGASANDLVAVSPAQVSVTLRLPNRQEMERMMRGVRVRVSGTPELFDRATVEIDHPVIDVMVSGPQATVAALTPPMLGAYVALEDADEKQAGEQEKLVRYQLPEGVHVVRSSAERVKIKLTAHDPANPPGTRPASAPAGPR